MAETDIIHHNSEPDEKLIREIYLYLCDNISPKCLFHDATHTMQVLDNVRQFAGYYPAISPAQKRCLLTAALFHDTGYAETYFNNEPVAAGFAAAILPDHGYSPDEIKVIQSLILATEFYYEPQNLPEMIIRDADLGHIGTPEYRKKALLLKQEHDFFVRKTDYKEWLAEEISFLQNHRFHQPWLEAERHPHRQAAIAGWQKELDSPGGKNA